MSIRRFVVAHAAITLAAVSLGGTPVHAEVATLALVTQSFNVAPAGAVSLTVRAPNNLAADSVGLSLAVTAYRPITDRDALDAAIAGDLTRNIDTVEVTAQNMLRPAADEVQVVVPVEITTRTPEALQLSKPGLYPVLVELRSKGDSVAELVTFIHRVPGDSERTEDPLRVAFAATGSTTVRLDDSANVVVDEAGRTELTNMAGLLETAAVPISVRLEPSELAAIAAADADGAALIARLDTALRAHQLVSAPAYPLDPSVAGAAAQGALYTQWLRDGEDVVARSVAASPTRTVAFISKPLSRTGAGLLRELGARLLVLTPAEFASLAPADASGLDTTQLIELVIATDVTIDSIVADPRPLNLLQRHADDTALATIYAVADLMALRNSTALGGGDPTRHGVLVAAPDLGLPGDGFARFTQLLAETPGLRASTVDEISIRTDQLIADEEPVTLALPDSVPGDLGPRLSTVAAIELQSVSAASMLPDGDVRPAEWKRLAEMLPSAALADDQVDRIATTIRGEHAALLGSIEVPNGFSFNLTGRTGTVRFSLKNTNSIPLTVRIRLSSPKLIASENEQNVVLAPGGFTEIKLPIRARSNGRFPAALELFTPSGDVRLAAPIPITANITALSGLGNLVTGAGLLVVLTWWVRHLGKNRRARSAGDASQHHPAAPATTLPDS